MFDAMKSKFNNSVEAGLGGQIIVGKMVSSIITV
jgi:hypothetical protein